MFGSGPAVRGGRSVRGFVSDGATRRALQRVGNAASVDIEVRTFSGAGRPVLLGITERLEFVDVPGHAEDPERYRARGYTMRGNRIAVATDRSENLVEVHPPSRGSLDLGGLSDRRCPPASATRCSSSPPPLWPMPGFLRRGRCKSFCFIHSRILTYTMHFLATMRIGRMLALSLVLIATTLGIGPASALVWQNETVDSAGDVGETSSLALDAAGHPRISYCDWTNYDLKYAWHDGTGWRNETVDAAGDVGTFTSLALDAAGNPRISYYDSTNGNLKYAWHDGTGWRNETVDAAGDVGRHTSLALDAAGTPRISYCDVYPNYDLKYAWRDGTDWRNETVDSTANVRGYSSLALDAAGAPRISYFDDFPNQDLKYAWRDGTGWQIGTVDAAGDVGRHSSLALGAAGTPRISYCDEFPGYDLKYAAWTDTGWQIETVPAAGSAGTDTSLALDAAGYPRIVYWGDGLKYAAWTGAGWEIETVDAAGVGPASLALDAAGHPRISYSDYPNLDLKYAWAGASPPEVVTVPGGAGVPMSLGGHGKYDDVNGNGRKDFADVVLYFNQMSWIEEKEPVEAFDYNGNGVIDFADIVWLFNHL